MEHRSGTLDQPPTLLDKADSVELVDAKTPDPGDPRHAHLAELKICADHQARPGRTRSTSRTTSTGMSATFC